MRQLLLLGFCILASITGYAQPANDDCSSATALPINGPTVCIPLTFSNTDATDSGVEHSCANYQDADIWFSFTAPADGGVYIETAAVDSGITDSGIALYSGDCGSLTEVACNDDGGAGLFSLIEALDLVPGDTYYIALWSYANGSSGEVDICLYLPPTCIPTELFEVVVDSTGFDSAVISWPNYNPGSTFVIEFGLDGFTPGTGTVITGVNGVDGPPYTINGLTIGTDYDLYFQEACAADDSAAVVGPRSFETLYLPPANDGLCDAVEIIVNDPPSTFTNSGATIETGEISGSCFLTPAEESVWMTFVGPENGVATVTTDFEDQDLHDTQIAVYTLDGDCTDLSNLTEIGCDEDGGEAAPFGFTSVVMLTDLTPGQTYYVQVEGYGANDGEFDIQVLSVLSSISELNLNAFSIAPNPSTGLVSIDISELKHVQAVQVIDVQGRVSQQFSAQQDNAGRLELDLNDMAKGIYVIRLIGEDFTSSQRLILE